MRDTAVLRVRPGRAYYDLVLVFDGMKARQSLSVELLAQSDTVCGDFAAFLTEALLRPMITIERERIRLGMTREEMRDRPLYGDAEDECS
jgi:hypothetical protein